MADRHWARWRGYAVRWGRWLRTRAVAREARTLPTILLALFCVVVCLPLAIVLTPDQRITIAGQQVWVGARDPDLSVSGPAQLTQVGNTDFDITALRIAGPLRPRLTLGPVQRNDGARAALTPEGSADLKANAADIISGGFIRWYALATLLLLGLTIAATAVVGCVRMLAKVRRLGLAEHGLAIPPALWRQLGGQLVRSGAVAAVVAMLAWATAGVLAYDGTADGLKRVRSLADLVGTYHLSPSPVGPTVRGFDGAVIGDSRAARVGGPAPAQSTPDDQVCGRSTVSLAAEIGHITGTRVRNLACSGASITAGLRGPQAQGGRLVPPQIGYLKQMEGLRFVVVVVGPNDLYWSDFLRYCYGVGNCQDNLTQGEFALRLAAFDGYYGDLLQDLNDLADKPQIIIVTSYDLFSPEADCPDAQGPQGVSGLSPDNMRLLAGMNQQLNDVLTTGAEKYRFTVATPSLSTLCQAAHPQLGRDLQGLGDSHPFHPTGVGVIRMAASVAVTIARPAEPTTPKQP